jgi:hypothetical protein
MLPIRSVWFDVGEVLINETHEYGTWADWLGIPRHTLLDSSLVSSVCVHLRPLMFGSMRCRRRT